MTTHPLITLFDQLPVVRAEVAVVVRGRRLSRGRLGHSSLYPVLVSIGNVIANHRERPRAELRVLAMAAVMHW